ncbi:MAG TPA: PAS domain-containing sensor histidine kinase [Polyangia bacterium]
MVRARMDEAQRPTADLTRVRGCVCWESDPGFVAPVVLNPVAVADLGYPRADATGPGFLRVHLVPEDLEPVVALCRAVAAEATARELHCRVLAADGRVIAYHVEAHPGPTGVFGLMVATGEGDLAAALALSEQRFADLAEAAFDAVVLHEQGRIVFANQAFARLFGYGLADLVGRSLLELAAPESRDLVREKILSGAEGAYEAVGLHRDGRRLRGELRGTSLRFAGRMMRLTAIRDVTALRASQEALERSEHRLRRIIESAPDAIGVHAEGQWLYVNRALVALAGRASAAELLGAPAAEAVHPDDRPLVRERIQRMIRTGLPEPAVLERVLRPDGTVVDAEVAAAPIAVEDKTAIVVFARDVTERTRAEEERARLFAETQRAVRLREEFLSIAAHELRTPVTSLQLAVQSLERVARAGPLTDARVAFIGRAVEIAARQSRRLTQLVAALLDISRVQAGRFVLTREPVDLGALVREAAVRLGEDLAMAGCELSLETAPEVIGHWDRLRLDQVVTNLLANALKFGAGKPVEVRVEREADLARITVRDYGIGIPPDRIGVIFDRFERAVSADHYGGLGLGLFIVRLIVEAHQGAVRVAGEPGRGATFTVELPAR